MAENRPTRLVVSHLQCFIVHNALHLSDTDVIQGQTMPSVLICIPPFRRHSVASSLPLSPPRPTIVPLEVVQIVAHIIQKSNAFEASLDSYFARGRLIKFAKIRNAPGIPAGSWRNQA